MLEGLQGVESHLVLAMMNVLKSDVPVLYEIFVVIWCEARADITEHGHLVGEDMVSIHQEVKAIIKTTFLSVSDERDFELLSFGLQYLAH